MADVYFQWANKMFRVPDDGSIGVYLGNVSSDYMSGDNDSSVLRGDASFIAAYTWDDDSVLRRLSGTLTVEEAPFGNLLWRNGGSDYPGRLALDGQSLYLLMRFDNIDNESIIQIDLTTGERINGWVAPDAQGQNEYGFDVRNGGAYYLSASDGTSIRRFDFSTGQSATVFTEDVFVEYFAVDPKNGDFWVAKDRFGRSVVRRDRDGNLLGSWDITNSEVDWVLHLYAAAPDGMMWYGGNGVSDGSYAFSRFEKDGTGIGTRLTHLSFDDTGTANGEWVGFVPGVVTPQVRRAPTVFAGH